MADIGTVYDNIKAELATLFPNHSRLPNPQKIEANGDDFLKQGYAFRIAPGGPNTQRFVSKTYSQLVGMEINLTRQAYFSPTAPDRYDTVYKALLADIDIILKSAHRAHLEAGTGTVVKVVDFRGIQTLTPKTESFLVATVNVDIEYHVSN